MILPSARRATTQTGMLDTGRVYVYYGCQQPTGSRLNSSPDWEFSYPQAYANTGIDVSSGGDTNNDGYDELLVGVHLFDDEQANEGAVFAFFGCAARHCRSAGAGGWRATRTTRTLVLRWMVRAIQMATVMRMS